MADSKQGAGVLDALDKVRDWGDTYRSRIDATAHVRGYLAHELRQAYRAGASVTELAEASGLTRPTVYRIVRQPPQQ